ncbi:MAG: hypothetical protein QNK23_08200 [Crocinitomicaceae bacterium]|nr:hypothetical protein [Crocinitomicaceae bacterium]
MKKFILPFFAISMLLVSCTSSETSTGSDAEGSGDAILEKITLMFNNYDEGVKPGLPLADIVNYDAAVEMYDENPRSYESKFENEKIRGVFFYQHYVSEESVIDEVYLDAIYMVTTDEATGEDIVIDYSPYVDYISEQLGVSHKMGSEENGEEEDYFWDKDGFVFHLEPQWDGLTFFISVPEE